MGGYWYLRGESARRVTMTNANASIKPVAAENDDFSGRRDDERCRTLSATINPRQPRWRGNWKQFFKRVGRGGGDEFPRNDFALRPSARKPNKRTHLFPLSPPRGLLKSPGLSSFTSIFTVSQAYRHLGIAIAFQSPSRGERIFCHPNANGANLRKGTMHPRSCGSHFSLFSSSTRLSAWVGSIYSICHILRRKKSPFVVKKKTCSGK